MIASQYPTRSSRRLRTLRRLSQGFFLAVFVVFLYLTEFSFTAFRSPDQAILPSAWLRLFLDIDPLTGVATGLSSWIVYGSLLLSMAIIAGTVFWGRFFCGWACPLGTLNHLCSSFSSEKQSRKSKRLIESNKYHKYLAWKYYILMGLLALALLGSVQTGLFDPITIAGRSIGLVIIPALNAALQSTADFFSNSPVRIFSLVGKGIYYIGSGAIIYFKQPHFHGVVWIALIFAAILIANRIITRFWCRGLCPLGALLGIFSRFSIFGLKKDHSRCNDCGICLLSCQGGDDPHGGVPHRRAECHVCLNCLAACPEGVISFGFEADVKHYKPAPELTTRRIILAGIAGLTAFPVLRSGDDLIRDESFIRPPGSMIEEDFLKRCIRCGQCMKICPTNALHPALLETGWEGIFTPILIARIGYCEQNCVLCGHACPTGSIAKLDPGDKIGDSENPPLKIGTAFFDKGRCLPWGSGIPCIVCEEWCPTSPKAIWLDESQVIARAGIVQKIKLPHIDPERCTGCGVCEKVCPVSGKSGVYVTSAGESRDPRRALLLRKEN